jgi:hypothetical protein
MNPHVKRKIGSKKYYFKVVWVGILHTFVEKGVERLLDFIDNEGLPALKLSKKMFCRLHVSAFDSLKEVAFYAAT